MSFFDFLKHVDKEVGLSRDLETGHSINRYRIPPHSMGAFLRDLEGKPEYRSVVWEPDSEDNLLVTITAESFSQSSFGLASLLFTCSQFNVTPGPNNLVSMSFRIDKPDDVE